MRMLQYLVSVFSLTLLIFTINGCRGWTSTEPPIHLNPNMDIQPKYLPLRESEWFADKRDMRPLEVGVISRGSLEEPFIFDSKTVDMQLLKKGQEKFNIYCSACHDQSGSGKGLVGKRMPVPPASLHLERLLDVPHAYIFDVITNGKSTMPALGSIIPVKDRWAIVAYVRALQMSQDANREWAWKQ